MRRIAILVLLLLSSFAVTPAARSETGRVRCTIVGTRGDDDLRGTNGRDVTGADAAATSLGSKVLASTNETSRLAGLAATACGCKTVSAATSVAAVRDGITGERIQETRFTALRCAAAAATHNDLLTGVAAVVWIVGVEVADLRASPEGSAESHRGRRSSSHHR